MGNRSRRRRHRDGSIDAARLGAPPVQAEGPRNDPLYGIPDTNMPELSGIRVARALSGPDRPGHRGRRRRYAAVWLGMLLVGVFAGSFGWLGHWWP